MLDEWQLRKHSGCRSIYSGSTFKFPKPSEICLFIPVLDIKIGQLFFFII